MPHESSQICKLKSIFKNCIYLCIYLFQLYTFCRERQRKGRNLFLCLEYLAGLKHNCLLWLLKPRITSVKTQWQKEEKIICNAFLVVSMRLSCNQYIFINYAFRSQEELVEEILLPFQSRCQEENIAKLMELEEIQFCSSDLIFFFFTYFSIIPICISMSLSIAISVQGMHRGPQSIERSYFSMAILKHVIVYVVYIKQHQRIE